MLWDNNYAARLLKTFLINNLCFNLERQTVGSMYSDLESNQQAKLDPISFGFNLNLLSVLMDKVNKWHNSFTLFLGE